MTTPKYRAAVHAAIDHAINTGAGISINLHPRTIEAEAECIRRLVLDHSYQREDFNETEPRFSTVKVVFGPNQEAVVFCHEGTPLTSNLPGSERAQVRPAAVAGERLR